VRAPVVAVILLTTSCLKARYWRAKVVTHKLIAHHSVYKTMQRVIKRPMELGVLGHAVIPALLARPKYLMAQAARPVHDAFPWVRV